MKKHIQINMTMRIYVTMELRGISIEYFENKK
jgi:hypothetical protein